ncbi:hypothetical protein FOZ62_025137, partial [Perkinsus olseni]
RETFEDEKDDVWDKKEQDSDSESEDSDDGDNRALYNPLNLPLGWDGKPIPFWLYKLHGLGKPFRCEICGNYTYWGRRAFERHFTEWRHAHGMKCLRIPNSKHFHDITRIEDAITLYEKLRREQAIQGFDPDTDIECEDNMGSDPHGLFRYAGPGPFIGEQGLIVLAFGEYMGSLDRKSIFVEARNISYKVLHEEIIVDLSGIPFWTRSIMEVANITYATAATIRLTFPYPFNGTTMELQRLPK